MVFHVCLVTDHVAFVTIIVTSCVSSESGEFVDCLCDTLFLLIIFIACGDSRKLLYSYRQENDMSPCNLGIVY